MKLLDALRRMQDNKTVTSVQLMTENGNRLMGWQGNLYDMDVVRAAIRPKVKAVGKLIGKHLIETIDAETGKRSIKEGDRVAIRMLLSNPNPVMTGQMLQEKLATQLCLNNNAFAVIIRDDNGSPVAIYPVMPSNVEAKFPHGELHLAFTLRNNKVFEFPYTDVIHLRQDYYDNDIFGTPIAPALIPLLDVVSTTDQGIVRAVRNSGIIKWLLEFTSSMRPEDLKKRSEEFAANFLATSAATGVAATDSKAKATQVTPSDYVPNAAQMDRTTKRIQMLFNTNPKIVDGSRSEDEWGGYFDSEVEPVLMQLNGEYTRTLFSRRERAFGNKVAFEASAWDGASLRTKLSLVSMVDRGALMPNEWRSTFNLVPEPGGDEPIRRLDTAPTRQEGDEGE